MNLLYLCDEYPPCQHGGIGTVVQLLARTMAAKGHNVYVAGFYPYYRKAKKEESDRGVKVFRFFYGSKWFLKFSKHKFFGRFFNIENQFNAYLNKIKKIIRLNKIEIIETPDFAEAFFYSGPRMIRYPDFGVPLIIKLHGTTTYFDYIETNVLPTGTIFKKEKQFIDMASGIIALSEFVKEEMLKLFRPNANMEVIYNGISSDFSIHYNSNADNNNVIFAGTLAEKKGIFSLIQAWGIVVTEMPSAKLMIYGKGSAKTIEIINEIIAHLPKNAIELKGFISKDKLPDLYANSSCAIFPSYAETFGMAPIEAMAVGCPTIFTKKTSGPEIIDHGIDGLLVDPYNIKEIADAILFMLQNRQEAIEMGLNGKKKVKAKFDINLIAEKHEEYYSQFIS